MSTDSVPLIGQGVTVLDELWDRLLHKNHTRHFFILATREMATHNARHLLWPSSFTLSMTKSHRPSSRYTITSMSSTVWCVCVSYKWDHRPFYSAFQKLTTRSCNYRQTIATLCYSNSCMFLLRFHTVNIVWHRTLSTGPGENWSFTQKHW